MIGSTLYFVALLATAEMEIAQETINSQELAPTEQIEIANTANTNTPEKIAAQEVTPITITNDIEPSMLSYKHWTGTYSPDEFTVFINGTEISTGQTYTLADSKEPLLVRFDYSFMKGTRKGSKAYSYKMNENISTAHITFSWLQDWKIIIDNATPLKEETV